MTLEEVKKNIGRPVSVNGADVVGRITSCLERLRMVYIDYKGDPEGYMSTPGLLKLIEPDDWKKVGF
jgi:hypothetical protein